MRIPFKTIALFAALSLAATSCQKDNDIYPMVGSEPFVGPKC